MPHETQPMLPCSTTPLPTAVPIGEVMPPALMPGALLAKAQHRPLPPTDYAIPECAPQWSLRLNALIESPWDRDPPLLSPDMRAEADAALATIAEGKAPCTRSEINRMVGKLALLYPHARMSDVEARGQMQGYADLLDRVPAYALRAGFRHAAQTIRFFPTVAELIAASHYPMSLARWREMRLIAMIRRTDAEAAH